MVKNSNKCFKKFVSIIATQLKHFSCTSLRFKDISKQCFFNSTADQNILMKIEELEIQSRILGTKNKSRQNRSPTKGMSSKQNHSKEKTTHPHHSEDYIKTLN